MTLTLRLKLARILIRSLYRHAKVKGIVPIDGLLVDAHQALLKVEAILEADQ